ncbi:MAG: PAS domain S-box protein [Desulfobacteraceae bacterium]|nr:PAS domain S-box protein [Desulfobacteraceae bacterium]
MDKQIQGLAPILEALEDGVYIIRDDYTIEFMNQVMVEDFGEGTGKKCFEVIGGCHEICPWCKANEVFEGKTLRYELYVPTVKKSYNLIELPLRNEDGAVCKLSIYRDITERKERIEKIKASEEDYRRLFEHVPCGVYISTREGKFLDTNQALLDMLEYESKEEFLEIDIARDAYFRPEDREKFIKKIEQNGQVIDYEVDFKRKDGTPIPILLTAHVRYDQQGEVLGYEGINLDQTQRKQMERELKEAHRFLNNIIQSSPNAIIATDLNGNIIIWNRAAEESLGYTAEDVIGKMNIDMIYPPGMAKKIMKMMRSPEYGGVGMLTSYPIVYRKKDKVLFEGNISSALIYDEGGNAVASVGVIVDLKERLEMERKLRQTQEQLLQSEKLAAMGRLTSQIAHELNNPLYGIMNTLELMKTEIPPENKRRKILEMALSETVRLAELLRKMLSFSKPDQEEMKPTDINRILDELLILHEKQLREHSIKMSTSFADDLGEIYGSNNQLRQVFLNMISNARDAMPEGGTLNVKTKDDGDNILIEISDTGIGIEEGNLKKIFDPFFSTKRSSNDVGIGLAVCYGFINDHEGDIKVESEHGSGTTFSIMLPKYKGVSEEH